MDASVFGEIRIYGGSLQICGMNEMHFYLECPVRKIS